jgi:hypothetical protein
MTGGIPVRLSAGLTVSARTAAKVLDRSLTDQVEHWARLGEAVESAISARTVQRLKARSYDPGLAQRLAAPSTAAGQARATKLIRERNVIRHGIGDDGAIVRVVRPHKRTRRARSR